MKVAEPPVVYALNDVASTLLGDVRFNVIGCLTFDELRYNVSGAAESNVTFNPVLLLEFLRKTDA